MEQNLLVLQQLKNQFKLGNQQPSSNASIRTLMPIQQVEMLSKGFLETLPNQTYILDSTAGHPIPQVTQRHLPGFFFCA
jgi:hypothetical protein